MGESLDPNRPSGYIDHQSSDTLSLKLSNGDSHFEDNVKNFIFNKNSVLALGNDNEIMPINHEDPVNTVYSHSISLIGKINDKPFVEKNIAKLITYSDGSSQDDIRNVVSRFLDKQTRILNEENREKDSYISNFYLSFMEKNDSIKNGTCLNIINKSIVYLYRNNDKNGCTGLRKISKKFGQIQIEINSI